MASKDLCNRGSAFSHESKDHSRKTDKQDSESQELPIFHPLHHPSHRDESLQDLEFEGSINLPVTGHVIIGIFNHKRSIFIPIIRFLCIWIRYLLLIHPVIRLVICRVINGFRRIDGRFKIRQKTSSLDTFLINKYLKRRVRLNMQGV